VCVREDFLIPGCDVTLPNLLVNFHVSATCLQASPSPKYYIDEHTDNHIICDATMDLGHEDKMFNMLGVSVDDYVSPSYFRGYDLYLDPRGIYLIDKPRKIMSNTFFDFSFAFSMELSLLKRALSLL